jgi:hypothetical protein
MIFLQWTSIQYHIATRQIDSVITSLDIHLDYLIYTNAIDVIVFKHYNEGISIFL